MNSENENYIKSLILSYFKIRGKNYSLLEIRQIFGLQEKQLDIFLYELKNLKYIIYQDFELTITKEGIDFLETENQVDNNFRAEGYKYKNIDFSKIKSLDEPYIPKKFLKKIYEFGIRNINVIGTMHEIGYWEGEVDNDTTTNPISFYGIAKNSLRQSLKILEDSDKELFIKWLRVFYIQGDDRNNNSIFSKILQKEEEGAKTFPFTTGKNKYDFINISILAEMISKASLQTEVTGIINCCSGKPVSLNEKVESFLKENNLKIKLEYGVFPDRSYDSPAIWGNNSIISKIMNNKVKKDF